MLGAQMAEGDDRRRVDLGPDDEDERLLTTAAAARISGLDRGTILWRAACGLIRPAARGERGKPLWRQREVLRLKGRDSQPPTRAEPSTAEEPEQ
jgi:hypothetical protein